MKSLTNKSPFLITPVLLVGTYDEHDRANLMSVAWGGICCSKPPCIAISLREATYSYGNIVKRQAFTVHIPGADMACEADYVGIYSGRNEDKLAALNLSATKSDLVDAPLVTNFPLIMECKVLHTIPIGLHTQFIGEVLDVKVDAGFLNERNEIILEKLDPMLYLPILRSYHHIGGKIGRAFDIGIKREPHTGIE